MPLNAPIKDRIISERHLTVPPKFKGSSLAIISNQTEAADPPENVREYIVAMVVTTTNITLNDEQTIDGVSITEGMTVLVNAQTDKTQNGLYICLNDDDWQRMNNIDLISGYLVVVRQGTYADTLWVESLEFERFESGTTELEWVPIGLDSSIPILVEDTNTVDLTLTLDTLTADVLHQDSTSVELSDDSSGLKAEVKIQQSDSIEVINSDFDGLIWNLKIDEPGSIGTIPLITSDGLKVLHNFNAGIGIEFLPNVPSGGAVQIKHNLSEGDAIEMLPNDPSTGNLKIGVADDGITTDKIADDAVTTDKIGDGAVTAAKIANHAVGRRALNIELFSDFLQTISLGGDDVFYLGFNDTAFTHGYKLETFTTSGVSGGTVKSFRIPSNSSEYLPIGIYHLDIFGEISAVQVGMGSRIVRHVQAPVLTIKPSGGGGTIIAKGATHADPVTGTHAFVNTSLHGSLIIDLTSSTQADRYFEIEFDLTITDSTGAANAASASGYCHIYQLKPYTALGYET